MFSLFSTFLSFVFVFYADVACHHDFNQYFLFYLHYSRTDIQSFYFDHFILIVTVYQWYFLFSSDVNVSNWSAQPTLFCSFCYVVMVDATKTLDARFCMLLCYFVMFELFYFHVSCMYLHRMARQHWNGQKRKISIAWRDWLRSEFAKYALYCFFGGLCHFFWRSFHSVICHAILQSQRPVACFGGEVNNELAPKSGLNDTAVSSGHIFPFENRAYMLIHMTLSRLSFSWILLQLQTQY